MIKEIGYCQLLYVKNLKGINLLSIQMKGYSAGTVNLDLQTEVSQEEWQFLE